MTQAREHHLPDLPPTADGVWPMPPGKAFFAEPTLRDYFAAAALTGCGLGLAGMDHAMIAGLAYAQADAMLAQRSK